MSNQYIIVSIYDKEEPIKVGKLWFHSKKNSFRSTFEYYDSWLNSPRAFAIQPSLSLTSSPFHTTSSMALFGVFSDLSPDRWGRVLMKKAQLNQDKENNSTPKRLSEIDYLLRVNDEARQGALRFSYPEEEKVFLSFGKPSIPPLVKLSELLLATENFIEDKSNKEEMNLLLAPGSSLGGARPKASVYDRDLSLAIAKFTRKDDEYSIITWEAVALSLAKKAKINVPEFRLEYINNKPVLLIKRFDRALNKRIHFLSSMSMLEAQDNEEHSYLEIAYAIIKYGAKPAEDLKELYRRIVFNIMISNVDDHLRNHAFLYIEGEGWRLSPAYDLNPTPEHIKPKILTTAINFDNSTASLLLALEVAKEFYLNNDKANEIINEVKSAVEQWRAVAKSFGLSKKECDYMSSAFDYN